MEIRARQEQDLDPLEGLARRVHHIDGYPPYVPDDHFLAFLKSEDAIGAWVAIVDNQPVGHIGLHSRSSPEVMALASRSVGVNPDQIGVVARLLVDPDMRRTGIAQALLEVALSDAGARNLVPILDVVEHFAPAIALYEHQGWARLGTVAVELPNGTTMNEHVYAAPTQLRQSGPGNQPPLVRPDHRLC